MLNVDIYFSANVTPTCLQFCKCNARVWGSGRRRSGHVHQHHDAAYLQQSWKFRLEVLVYCSTSEMLVSVCGHLGMLLLLHF